VNSVVPKRSKGPSFVRRNPNFSYRRIADSRNGVVLRKILVAPSAAAQLSTCFRVQIRLPIPWPPAKPPCPECRAPCPLRQRRRYPLSFHRRTPARPDLRACETLSAPCTESLQQNLPRCREPCNRRRTRRAQQQSRGHLRVGPVEFESDVPYRFFIGTSPRRQHVSPLHPLIKMTECKVALHPVPFFAVADFVG